MNASKFYRYNTFYKNSQTVSQSIFDWAYRGQTRTKLILHGVIYCLDEWLENVLPHLVKRVYSLLLKFFFAKKTKQVNEENEELNNSRRATSVINYFITVYRLAKFINYLVFLYQGKYCHLWERLLQLRPVYKKPPAMRTFNHDVTMREVLWQSYFSVFTLLDRVFNLRKLMRNFATKVSRTSTSRANTKVDDCLLCAICESEPIAVHRSINRGDQNACKHVFCYICAKRELLDKDGKFNCPVCSKLIFDIELFIQSQIL